ncbi:MAG: O-antigen ligase family protein [Hyphomicrobiaceae bacterium]
MPYVLMSFVALLALGGATRSGFLSLVISEFIGVAFLVGLLVSPRANGLMRRPGVWIAPALLAVVGLVAAIQLAMLALFPVPPSEALLGVGDFLLPTMVQAQAGYAGASIWEGLSAAIIPVAVFLVVASLTATERIRWTIAVLAFGGFSVLLGLLQGVQGPASPLRPFSVTNPTEAVGLFANRNHYAALLYVTLVLACAWLPGSAARAMARHGNRTSAVVWLAIVSALVLACLAGLAMARSRAGVGLTILGLLGIGYKVWRSVGAQAPHDVRSGDASGWRRPIRQVATGIVVFSIVFALQFGLGRILTRFQDDPLQDLRVPLFWNTLEAAFSAMPFGTGMGSFVGVYASLEKNHDLIVSYVNRAHNDFLESFLEVGVFAPVALVVFALWLVSRARDISGGLSAQRRGLENMADLQFAALLAILLLLAHSWVDYPLRTGTLAALFAFLCALLTPPTPEAAPAIQDPSRSKSRVKPKRRNPVVEVEKQADVAATSWKNSTSIPSEWRRGNKNEKP